MVQSYKWCDASRFAFDAPDLLEIQRAGYYKFLKQGITDLFSKHTPIRIDHNNTTIELVIDAQHFQFIPPEDNPRECILKMKTYSSKLYVKAKIVCKATSGDYVFKTREEWVCVGHLPMMTKRGHFIINGAPRVVVHQIVRSPGIYFQQVVDKRDDNKAIRYYGDVIPYRGVWLRLQSNKKGRIEAKLKKGKKVNARMLYKCFKLIESEHCEKDQANLPPTLTALVESQALLYTYNKLYRPTEDREKEEVLKRVKTSSFESNAHLDKHMKIKRCYRNLYTTFKEKNRYDLGNLGREKINLKLDICVSKNQKQLSAADIKAASCWLQEMTKGKKSVDDIDHLQNRRVRTSGEMFAIQFETGVERLNKFAIYKLKEFLNRQITDQEPIDQNQNRSLNFTFGMNRAFLPSAIEYRKSGTGTRARTGTGTGTGTGVPDLRSAKAGVSYLRYAKAGVSDLRSAKGAGKMQMLEARFPFWYLMLEQWLSPKADTGSLLLSSNGKFEGKHKRLASNNQLEHLLGQPLKGVLSGQTQKRQQLQSKRGELASTYPLMRGDTSFMSIEKGQALLKAHLPQAERQKKKGILSLQGIKQQMSAENNCFSQQALFGLDNFSLKEFFSTKPINGALRELFSTNPLSQYMDQTNPLAEMTHKRRMSSLGVGGVSRESAGMAIRGIHPTHYGRICPIETPEGKNAGLVNSLAFYARLDDQGFIRSPYFPVIKGQVQEELGLEFLSAMQESRAHLYLAPSDSQQSKNRVSTTNSVPVRVADNLLDLFKKIDWYQVDCIGISPIQMISVATSLIPFLEHNDANRALMGSNMQRQAVPLMISERPIVGTGLESLVLAESGHVLQSKVTGFVSYVSADKISIQALNITLEKSEHLRFHWKRDRTKLFNRKLLLGNPAGTAKSYLRYTKAKNRQRVSAWGKKSGHRLIWRAPNPKNEKKIGRTSEPVFDRHVFQRNTKIRKQEFKPPSLCRNPRSGFFQKTSNHHSSWAAYKHAKMLVQQNIDPTLSSCFSFPERLAKSADVLETFIHPIENFGRSNQDTCLTQRALVKEGDWVQKGDILTDCSASDHGELSVGKNLLVAYIPWEGFNFEDAIVISERLVKEHVYTSLHVERYDFAAQDVKQGTEWFTNDLPGVSNKKVKHLSELGLAKIGSFVKEGDILVGKIRYSHKKPTTPYERLLCDILGENNFSARDSSLYVPKGVHARVIKHKVVKYSAESTNQKISNNIALPPFADNQSHALRVHNSSPKLIHVFLGEKRVIQVGDKMSGRHGNKGVVSKILPMQDMPYLPDGTPIDIILNPLGVPSRMNVGQVLEALLGLAGTYLKQNIKVTAFDELHGVEASQSLVFLKLYQARLQSGETWLFQVDFPGKVRLVDGRSGECFDQWITVGRAYMLKLIHMVNEKIHARATGPYALITQQPLRGRSQKGGQRLGEMEVWALEGYGAAYTLQELLTKKSDDMLGRKEIAAAILPPPLSVLDAAQSRSNYTPSKLMLGQPEIFKVLICELQALCLDVGVYSYDLNSFQRYFLDKLH